MTPLNDAERLTTTDHRGDLNTAGVTKPRRSWGTSAAWRAAGTVRFCLTHCT